MLALRFPTRQLVRSDHSLRMGGIHIRTMSITCVMELHKKRPQNKVFAAIEESKYNPVDRRSGKADKFKIQRLVIFMVFANCVVLLIAQQLSPEEMKKVIEEEQSVVVGSFKFWTGMSRKEKDSNENTKEDVKDTSKDYKSPLRDK